MFCLLMADFKLLDALMMRSACVTMDCVMNSYLKNIVLEILFAQIFLTKNCNTCKACL